MNVIAEIFPVSMTDKITIVELLLGPRTMTDEQIYQAAHNRRVIEELSKEPMK